MSWKFWLTVIAGYTIIAAVLYSPSIKGPWQYDDYAQILDQKVLTSRDLGKLLPSLVRFTAWPDGWTGTRDFVRATFWLNWKWWGLEPLGYRIVNLGIHVVNAVLVTVLVAELLGISARREARGARQEGGGFTLHASRFTLLPVLSGLLFLIHPIQSQAVAYVAQRFTSVATMGYVGAVVCWLFAQREKSQVTSDKSQVTSKKFILWYSMALLSALVAYNSKEITVTLPGVLFLVTVFRGQGLRDKGQGTREEITPTHRIPLAFSLWPLALLLPFFLLALKIPLQVSSASLNNFKAEPEKVVSILSAGASVEQKNPPPTKLEYFLTEQNVVRTYLRLVVLPIRQTLDYDYPITKQWDVGTVASGFLHLLLIGVGGWLFLSTWHVARSVKQETTNYELRTTNFESLRLIGLGLLWFYVTVGIESTFIAIPDVIYEHRVYLPFVGVAMAFAGGISYLISKKSYMKTTFGRRPSFSAFYVLLTTCYLLLGFATLRRAAVWGNEVRLWKDVYEKAPEKPRAVKNYGVVLAASGKYDEGIKHLLRAVELDPENADYWSNLGTAYLRSQRFEEAAPRFLRAYELGVAEAERTNTSLAKETAQYISDYGVALVQLKRGEDAKPAFERALELSPELYAARLGLGAAKNLLGDLDGAAEDFRRLTEEQPEQPDAFGNLATILTKQGKLEDALAVLLKLKKLHPSYEGIDSRIATVNKLLLQTSE